MPEQNSSISSFKQFLFKVLLPLAAMLCAGGIAFNYFFEQKVILNSEVVGAYKVNRIINENHPDEIPIFGSSRAEGGFIPDSLGSNFFNYGLSGTRYDVTLFFMEEECKKKKNTQYTILNLDLEGLQFGLGDIANYITNVGNENVRQLLGKNYRYYYNIPLIKYYGLYEHYLRDNLNNKMQLTKLSNKGAAIEKKVLTAKLFDILVSERRSTATIFATDTALWAKMTNIITTHPNRQFIFVVSPYHPSYFEKYANPEVANAFLGALRTMRNVHVLNFSKMPLPDDMFFNTSHLNYKGAAVFNHVLKDSLMRIGVR